MKRILLFILVLGLSASAVQAEESRTAEKDMVLIPAGPFVMGNKLSLIELDPADLFNTDRHALGPENPAHETILDAFYIDIHEVKNAVVEAILRLTRNGVLSMIGQPIIMDDEAHLIVGLARSRVRAKDPVLRVRRQKRKIEFRVFAPG